MIGQRSQPVKGPNRSKDWYRYDNRYRDRDRDRVVTITVTGTVTAFVTVTVANMPFQHGEPGEHATSVWRTWRPCHVIMANMPRQHGEHGEHATANMANMPRQHGEHGERATSAWRTSHVSMANMANMQFGNDSSMMAGGATWTNQRLGKCHVACHVAPRVHLKVLEKSY